MQFRVYSIVCVVLLACIGGESVASAETMESSLIRAYQSNPQLNAQRASVRATDENVPQALSGYRPHISITASGGYQYGREYETVLGRSDLILSGSQRPRSVGATVNQTLFNGSQTANRARAAEAQVSAAQEGLRVLEQNVLLSAATTYMDYLRDAAIVEVNRSNVRVLQLTLDQTRDRFKAGDVTRTDLAQAGAQLAAGKTQLKTAESNLTTTRANFQRIVGVNPQSPAPASPVDRSLPHTLTAAIDVALLENPNVTAALHGVDVNFLQVKINEGALFPTITLQANVQQSYEPALTVARTLSAQAVAQISMPIYQGGAEYALIRQSKEALSQQRMGLEQVRAQTRATVVQTWGQLDAAKSQITSSQQQVSESETALNGVRDEARVGQRTTLDVLNAQQALVTARIALVAAQHDRVVASYAVLSAIGRLSPKVLGLATESYDAGVHYQQVRDSWGGLRTPNGN